jgi:hypothetical protein
MAKLVSQNQEDVANWSDYTSSEIEFFKNGEDEEGVIYNVLHDTLIFFKVPEVGKYRLKYLPDGLYTGYGWKINGQGELTTTIDNVNGYYSSYKLLY